MPSRILLVGLALLCGGAVVLSDTATSRPTDPAVAGSPPSIEKGFVIPPQSKGCKAMAYDMRFAQLNVIGDVSGGTVPTSVGIAYLKVSDGPVLATWTGELFSTDASTDLVVAISAQEYDTKNNVTVGDPIVAFPQRDAGPLINYSVRINNTGFNDGVSTVDVVWPTGTLKKNKTYQFVARLGEFSGPATCSVDDSLLSVQAFKK